MSRAGKCRNAEMQAQLQQIGWMHLICGGIPASRPVGLVSSHLGLGLGFAEVGVQGGAGAVADYRLVITKGRIKDYALKILICLTRELLISSTS